MLIQKFDLKWHQLCLIGVVCLDRFVCEGHFSAQTAILFLVLIECLIAMG